MAATVRRQRRLVCWTLMAVFLADLLSLSGVYPSRGVKGGINE